LRWGGALALALAAYAGVGFLLVPRLLQRSAPARLEEAIGRKVVIERIRTNPFTLSIRVDGFAVLDTDGRTPALSWRSLFVDYELWAVVKREQRFKRIVFEQPSLRGGLRRDGTANFADVVERLRRRSAADPGDRDDGKPWTIAIDRLDIDAASVEFRDVSNPRPFQTTVGPVTLHMESFRTTADGQSPYSFSGRTEAGEAFTWTGTFRVAPLRSSGTLVIEDVAIAKYAPYYDRALLAEVRQGRVTVRATYELDLGKDRVVRLVDGELRARDVALYDRDGGERILSLPELDVTGIQLDALANDARVGRVDARNGVLSVRRDGGGVLNLAGVLAPQPPAKEPVRYEVGAIALGGWRVELDDRVPARPVELAATDVELTVEKLRSDRGAEAPIAAALHWPGGGTLRVAGTVSPARPAATLTVDADALALVPVEPYLAHYGEVRARVAEGTVRGKLHAAVDLASEEKVTYAVKGDAAVDGLLVLDAQAEEVVRWRALEAKGIDVQSDPASVQLDVLRVVEPRLRVIRRPDQTTNLAGLTAPAEPAMPAAGAQPEPKKVDPKLAKLSEPEPTPFRIGTIAVERGRVTVTDRSMSPAAVLRYTGVRARLTNFSSDARARTGVDVEALVEGTAPMRVAGTLNPRLVGDVTNVTVRSKGIDLTPFGPYSRRYVGYALERGKMDLDMRYRVKQRNLRADNVVRVDQLALGEKTESPDAPSFPMGLALAVLTDRHGVMLLDVPVEGNLDDPEFRLGRVIWRAVLNVLGKVAVAPFTAIAHLVGGGPDAKLDTIDFAAGSSTLDEASLGKLDQIAKALQDRPALKLEVEGVTDASTDGAALGREAVRALAAREKWLVSGPKDGAAPPADLVITDEEYPRYLKAAYESALREQPALVSTAAQPPPAAQGAPAAPQRKDGQPTPEAMEALLLERVDVGAALRNLSSERAAAVREQLVAREIDQARLFLAEGEADGKESAGPGVRLKLK
jgi:hypothetical protein